MKTLIVDDERVSRAKMKKILESFGECEAVDSGRGAIDAFKRAWKNRAPFDLITLDIVMPDMNGADVLYDIREIEKEKNIAQEKQVKILMVTSDSNKDMIITCIQAECDDYIVKPFDGEMIKGKLEKIKSGRRIHVSEIESVQAAPSTTKPLETKSNLKTLIVDDERVSRAKMKKILESFGECEAVDSGRGAIDAFKRAWENRAPFDLITLDIVMPDMNGADVLYDIREIEKEKNIAQEKQVKILMVTSDSNKDMIITCIQAECDDYIVKPFDGEMIKGKLEKIRSGRRIHVSEIESIQAAPSTTKPLETKSNLIEEIIFRFKRGEINLPSMPHISTRFKELISKGATFEEVGALLKQDVSIAFKLISVANSTYYRGVVENKTVEQAINRLGLTTTGQYVDTISNRSLFKTGNKKFGKLIADLWEHSLACAYASQIITEILNLKLSEDAFTMGLLHDIGKLVLLQVFGEMEMKGQLRDEINRLEMFNDLDTYHGKFGAALLKRWKFSKEYLQVSVYHDNLEKADSISRNLLVVCSANLLVKSMGYSWAENPETVLDEAESFRLLKMDSKRISETIDQVNNRMQEMAAIFK